MNLPSRSLSLRLAATVLVLSSGLGVFAADPPAKPEEPLPPMPPIQSLSPEDSLKTMKLKPGYHLELVLSEPEIKEPSMVAFDGDGRMFVTEFRTYMQEIDGLNEFDPVSRVSLHWSSKHDGVYDQHSVIADKLVLPRMILPLGKGQLLVSETNTNDIYLYTDTKGDGVADKKELWFEGGPRGGNLEHQPNGLLWSLDNWMYSTYNAYRLRWNPQGPPTKEPTAANGGQWGIGQDDHGKQWFVNAGGEKGPVNYQTPIVYGAFNTADQYPADFPTVWPLVGIADVQGGTARYRPEDKTLNHFTATSGSEIYRGDRLPADLKGDLIFGEPVGRLVRRSKVTVKEGVTTLANAYDKDEFIRSTDPLFRPINLATRSGRDPLFRGYVSRHHPGGKLGARRQLPSQGRSAVPARQADGQGPHLSPHVRGPAARPATRHVRGVARSTRRASRASQRLVARYRAKTDRAEPG